MAAHELAKPLPETWQHLLVSGARWPRGSDWFEAGALRFFGIERDGEPAAIVAVQAMNGCVELIELWVDPDHRRNGLAQSLIEALSTTMLDEGAAIIELEVRSKNRAALALYRSLGFSADGLRPRYYRDPNDDALLMSLKLIG
ncbi:GNAT family N-acetyltransferase [Gammaproteobacteria bacterium]|nr:GNAT family N-acetyltransferase [Gammaproteobacteria bacterium]